MKPQPNKLLSLTLFIGCLCGRKRQSENEIETAVPEPDNSDHRAAGPGPGPAYDVLESAGPKSTGANGMMIFLNTPTLSNVLGRGTSADDCREMVRTMTSTSMKDVNVSEMEFRERIEAIGKINHPNLLPLRAYRFYTDHTKCILYDHMPMGSLSDLLHGKRGAENGKTRVNWDTRIGIALGAARAIVHIHSLDPWTSHGNIKSSNILLTPTLEALVSEFGLAHAAGPSPVPHLTEGYHAPEVTDSSNVSQKADIYSFGVLLLELLTGKDPTESHFIDDGIDLSRWMLTVIEDELTSEVFELELLQHENVEEEMLQLLQLAFSCTAQDPDHRPSMAEVCSQIERLCCSSSQVYQTHTDVEGVNLKMTPGLRLMYW